MRRMLTPFCLALAALPAAAQGFPDAIEFGGSKVFSLGFNPLGNSARFDQAPEGWYMGYANGDVKPKDQPKALEALGQGMAGDLAAYTLAFALLKDNPWAVRERAYTIIMSKAGGIHASFSREERSSLMAYPDLDPAHRGSNPAIALNTTSFDQRRAEVNRLVLGAGSVQNGVAYGATMRLENWRMGQQTSALNPIVGQVPIGDPRTLLDFKQTDQKYFAFTTDAGVLFELTKGVQLGALVDRLIPRNFGDIKETPQVRAGLQMDMGGFAQLGVETDLNAAARVPFVAKQRSLSASLRILANPTVQLMLGGVRRDLGGVVSRSYGATVYIKADGILIGAGLQLGQEKPLWGAGLKVQ